MSLIEYQIIFYKIKNVTNMRKGKILLNGGVELQFLKNFFLIGSWFIPVDDQTLF